MITPGMVKPGAAVVDVGNHRADDRIVGDVAPEVAEVAGALTPVPGGVGPMTVALLLANTVAAARQDEPLPAAGGWPVRGHRRAGPAAVGRPRGRAPGRAPLRGLVDAVNVTDNATARVGMTPLAAAMLAAGEGDRPGAPARPAGTATAWPSPPTCSAPTPSASGPCSACPATRWRSARTGAKPVFDLDAVGLARLATDLGQGRAPGGTRIDPPARFLVGVAEAPGADPSGGARLAAKADAGATFVQTQPIYDVAQFAAWLDQLAARGLPDRVAILAGILPPTSAAQLERFATLPGWSVPDAVLDRIRGARDQRAEGIAVAAEMVQAVRTLPGVRGIHLMGLGPTSAVPEVAHTAGLLPRPVPR